MKEPLAHLLSNQTFSREEARNSLLAIGQGRMNSSKMAAFLSVYILRSPSVAELSGFRDALLDLCIPMNFESEEVVDLCGTGGDGKNTFNISTLASFVVAGAGIKVAKHGNYGVSSISGSSNVMEQLGYVFTNDRDRLRRQLERASICFLHAPLFHPAMKNVASVRKELGMKTFFNMLGPLVNPARPTFQSTGVFSMGLARMYRYLLGESGISFRVIHAYDGYDEISLTDKVKVFSESGEITYRPEELGFNVCLPEDLFGGDTVGESVNIFKRVIGAKGTDPQHNVVLANAAMAISGARSIGYEVALDMAKESLFSGKAHQSLNTLLSC